MLFKAIGGDSEPDWTVIRGMMVGRTLALVLGLASELEAFFDFGMHQQFCYLWAFLGAHIPQCRELFDKRYGNLIGSS
jgi:hypothetical protein